MSKNVVNPRSVSIEDALRNLAGRLTGRPTAELPRTQENIVQFMAENVPTVDELAEAVTKEVIARLSAPAPAEEPEQSDTAEQKPLGGPDVSDSTSSPDEEENPDTEAPAASDKRKTKNKAEKAE